MSNHNPVEVFVLFLGLITVAVVALFGFLFFGEISNYYDQASGDF